MGWETSNVAATVGQGVPQFNPLQTVGNIATIQNQINQNRLFQAQQAGGNALLNATGPDGAINQGSLRNNLMGMGPNAGLVAAQTLGQGQDLQRGGLANAGARISTMQAALASVPPVNPADPTDVARFNRQYNATLLAGAKQGLWSSDDAANASGGNINGLTSQEVQRQATLRAGNAIQLEQATGKAGLTDNGPGFVPTSTHIDPATGQEVITPIAGASVIPKGVAPQVVASDTGTGTQYTALPGVQPGSTAPTPLANVEKNLSQAAAATASGAQVGNMSGSQFASLGPASDAATNQKAMLGELQGILRSQDFKPGPASDWTAQLGGLAQEFGVPFVATPQNAKGTAALETYRKIATQIAQQQFGMLGGTGTDAKLSSAAHTSPDNLLSSLGNQEIIPLLQGNADAIIAKNKMAQIWLKHDKGPESYNDFTTQWNQIYDPRVFQAQHMSPDERQTMLNGMSKADRAQYQKDYQFALKHPDIFGITP